MARRASEPASPVACQAIARHEAPRRALVPGTQWLSHKRWERQSGRQRRSLSNRCGSPPAATADSASLVEPEVEVDRRSGSQEHESATQDHEGGGMPGHRRAQSAATRGGGRTRSRERPPGRAIRNALVGVLVAAFSLPATASAVDPTGPAPLFGGPSFFSLAVTGKVSGGASVGARLTAPHHLGLFVAREVTSNAEQPLALVSLGLQTAGPHQIRWSLTVHHRRLGAGTYEVLLEILDGRGHPSGIPPSPTFAFLRISSDGRDGVRLQHLTLH